MAGAGVVAAAVTAVPKVAVGSVPVVVGVAGVPGVVSVVVPAASAVFAMAVCVPRLATICSGSCPEGKGDTNSPVDISVGVARGACDAG